MVVSEKYINYKNRGMSFEADINITNKYYYDNNIAIIYKKPTPVKITKVEYKSRKGAKISEGFYTIPSTTDYNGIYKEKYLDFEAKETKCKTSFPLNNIHQHQITHLQKIIEHGGIAFIIVRFVILNKTFLLEAKHLLNICDQSSKKSIPLSVFEEKGYLIKDKYQPRVDYIDIINKIYFGG